MLREVGRLRADATVALGFPSGRVPVPHRYKLAALSNFGALLLLFPKPERCLDSIPVDDRLVILVQGGLGGGKGVKG